jgi:uncharacterized RDD family membrane protein YckC
VPGKEVTMSREILVVTPENIEIEYELAGIGTRFLANFIDTLFQLLALAAVAIGIGLLAWVFFLIGTRFSAVHSIVASVTAFVQGVAELLLSVVVFIVFWGYFIYYEIRWNGQTPGKRRLGLRVLRDGGYPINVFAAITRNLLRAVDGGMPLVVVGVIIAGAATNDAGTATIGSALLLVMLGFLLFTPKYQRLGDFVAGTMVVKQRAPIVPTLEALAPPPRVLPEYLAPYALKDIGRHVYEMTVPEYRAVRHAIDRRWQLPPALQQTAAMQLAVPLMKRLGITPPDGVQRINYADLLEYLAVAFEQYRGVK